MSKQRQNPKGERDGRDVFDTALDAPILPYILAPAGAFLGRALGGRLGGRQLKKWYGKKPNLNDPSVRAAREGLRASGRALGTGVGGIGGFAAGVAAYNRPGGALDRKSRKKK